MLLSKETQTREPATFFFIDTLTLKLSKLPTSWNALSRCLVNVFTFRWKSKFSFEKHFHIHWTFVRRFFFSDLFCAWHLKGAATWILIKKNKKNRKVFGNMEIMQLYHGMNLNCSSCLCQLFTSSTSKEINTKRGSRNNIGASYPWYIVAIFS